MTLYIYLDLWLEFVLQIIEANVLVWYITGIKGLKVLSKMLPQESQSLITEVLFMSSM